MGYVNEWITSVRRSLRSQAVSRTDINYSKVTRLSKKALQASGIGLCIFVVFVFVSPDRGYYGRSVLPTIVGWITLSSVILGGASLIVFLISKQFQSLSDIRRTPRQVANINSQLEAKGTSIQINLSPHKLRRELRSGDWERLENIKSEIDWLESNIDSILRLYVKCEDEEFSKEKESIEESIVYLRPFNIDRMKRRIRGKITYRDRKHIVSDESNKISSHLVSAFFCCA